jgi:hypothetical protein
MNQTPSYWKGHATGRIIIALNVKDILEEHLARKPA